MLDMPLIATKFHIPPAGTGWIARPHLFEMLNRGLSQPLMLISAPPGFGKTTLISGWLGQDAAPDGLKTAWLSLDENDNVPEIFWRYLIAAIQRVIPRIGQLQQAVFAASNLSAIQAILSTLINELTELESPLLLVLDDYHLIQSAEIHTGLSFLLDHLPDSSHLALLTREDPPLALARRRARGQILEVRSSDLRFDRQEITTFMTQARSLTLTPEQIRLLEQHTEGWAVGLQMAALSLQGRSAQPFFESFSGNDRYIADYLIEEVLQRQSDIVQSFLLKTSILERMTASLCAVLEGTPASAREILDHLERTNLFLVPLDNHREWYRYHHLFADLLRRRLHENCPAEEIAGLHRSASSWFEAQGDVSSAVHHARAIRDEPRVLHLLESHMGRYFRQSALPELFEQARAVPKELREASPAFCAGVAWAVLATNHFDAVEEWLQAIERHYGLSARAAISDEALDPERRAALLEVLVIRLQMPSDDSAAFSHAHIREIREQLNALPATQQCLFNVVAGLKPVIAFNLGTDAETSGDTAQAAESFREASELSRGQSNQHLLLLSLAHLAGTQVLQGHLQEAQATYARALAEIERQATEKSPYLSLVYAGLGALSYERNDLEAAEHYFEQALPLARLWNQWESLVPIALGRAHLKQRNGDIESALVTLGEVDSPPLAWMVPQVESYSALLKAQTTRQSEAAAWLAAKGTFLSRNPAVSNESALLNIARLMALLGRSDEAMKLIQSIMGVAAAGQRSHILIQANILMAKLLAGEGKTSEGLRRLEESLQLAGSEGYVSAFVDEGEAIRQLLTEQRSKVSVGLRACVEKVLAEFTRGAKTPGKQDAGTGPELSEREMEILGLVAEGLSNQEIAERLVISITTVKTHVGNIFNKLGVTSRTQAIARAEESGLLPRR